MNEEKKNTVFAAVVAMDEGRVIGYKGELPWDLPEDLKWFRKMTIGHPIIMGRKTFESIGRALPGRRNLVLTRKGLDPAPKGVEVVGSIEELMSMDLGERASVIGGEEIFRRLLPHCDEVLLGLVAGHHEGDTWFPPFEDQFGQPKLLQDGEKVRHYRFRRTEAPLDPAFRWAMVPEQTQPEESHLMSDPDTPQRPAAIPISIDGPSPEEPEKRPSFKEGDSQPVSAIGVSPRKAVLGEIEGEPTLFGVGILETLFSTETGSLGNVRPHKMQDAIEERGGEFQISAQRWVHAISVIPDLEEQNERLAEGIVELSASVEAMVQLLEEKVGIERSEISERVQRIQGAEPQEEMEIPPPTSEPQDGSFSPRRSWPGS